MKNKLLTLFLALAASVGTLFAQSGTCGDNLTWTLDTESGILTISGTGAMTDYTYSSGEPNTPWYSSRSSIKTVVIEDGVTSIGDYAFHGCRGLTSITIPNSVTRIGSTAFSDCRSLTSLTIPNSVTSIESFAFEYCSSMTSITIPNSVISIGMYAFNGCHGLTSIIIPNSVTSIENYVFINCRSLTSVTIPNSVTSILYNAFWSCTSLTSITVDSENPNYCDIDGVLFNKNKTTLIRYPEGKSASYTIPNSVTSIGVYAFGFCSKLTSITIPNSVTSIRGCTFEYCTGLISITCEAINPPELGNGVFNSVDKSIPLYVPAESVDDYKAADQWKDFNVQAIKDCTIETTDDITVWEDDLPYIWEDKTFTEAGTQTTTLKSMDGCDSIVTFTLRVRYNNIVLQENESREYYDNFAEDYNGVTVTTATLNRQFTQGKWATLCLPFNVNKAMMMSLGLYNRVFAFRYAQQLDDETIQVFFVPAQSIEAGKGYIVNPNAKLAAKTSFVFPNVTINTDSDNGDITALTGYNDGTGRGNLYLVGTLRTGILQGTTSGNTYLGLKDNQLYYPNTTSGTSIRAYRGFLRSDVPVNASRVRIIADGESVTELEVTVNEQGRMDNGQLQNNATPARKYIRNGLLFIERNGITYTAQGQRID